jgi:hypothetical protein
MTADANALWAESFSGFRFVGGIKEQTVTNSKNVSVCDWLRKNKRDANTKTQTTGPVYCWEMGANGRAAAGGKCR